MLGFVRSSPLWEKSEIMPFTGINRILSSASPARVNSFRGSVASVNSLTFGDMQPAAKKLIISKKTIFIRMALTLTSTGQFCGPFYFQNDYNGITPLVDNYYTYCN